LVEKIRICQTVDEKLFLIQELNHIDNSTVVSFANAHAFNMAHETSLFEQYLVQSDYLLRDGVGVSILYKLLGRPAGLNLNGTDLIYEILENADRDRRVALYGTESPWLDQAAASIKRMGFSDIATMNGFEEEALYIDHAQSYKPDIIILAMGMPKQERLSIVLKNELRDCCSLVINGGAILDFIAERHPRAPEAFQKFGIEWLYRLYREPKRLWKRNLGSLTFLGRSVFFAAKSKLARLT
jgi:exopolysaccharide biosynthesis WecB/TagA/CpsF family protein